MPILYIRIKNFGCVAVSVPILNRDPENVYQKYWYRAVHDQEVKPKRNERLSAIQVYSQLLLLLKSLLCNSYVNE